MTTAFENARAFIYRNARPLDFARFRFHFEGGDQEPVLDALAAYQNPDGGFGHGLEADAWNPDSAPIQTWAATEILREIGFADRSHPIVAGILKYLTGGQDFDGQTWGNTVPGNNDYPHAPWWHYTGESHETYNPTACLAGFILRFAEKESDASLGRRLAREAITAYCEGELLEDMHTAGCYVRLLEYLEEAKEESVPDLAALRERLGAQVRHCLTADTAQWDSGYICKPSQFFNHRDSVYYADNQALAQYECEFILRTQQPDGAWPIPWGWGDYPEEWALAKNWWQSNGIILNLLYLKGMRRL